MLALPQKKELNKINLDTFHVQRLLIFLLHIYKATFVKDTQIWLSVLSSGITGFSTTAC